MSIPISVHFPFFFFRICKIKRSFTVPIFVSQIGRALCVSILDMTGHNPNSRLPSSQYKSVNGLKESLRCEAILAKNVQMQQNFKMRQSIALLQVTDGANIFIIFGNRRTLSKYLVNHW